MSESLRRNLDILQAGDRVGVLVDSEGCLHLVVNGEDLGVVAEDIASRRYAVVDLYGCCEEVTIVSDQAGPWRGSASMEGTKAALGLGTLDGVLYGWMGGVGGKSVSVEGTKAALGLGTLDGIICGLVGGRGG